MAIIKPFQKPIRPEDVRELIDFGLPDEKAHSRYASMATLQAEGVAAIYSILCRLDFAYLADEVGMGKTYQALGVAAVLWNLKPNARIVFVSPRRNLQTKWIRDYTNFVRNNYRRPQSNTGDAILKCVLQGEPLIQPEFCDNLREFATSLSMPGRKVCFIRHTSFQRPLHFSAPNDGDLAEIWHGCRRRLESCGLWDYEPHLPCHSAENASWSFNVRFAQALKNRLRELGADGEPAIDLLIVDEAQCLRHPDNQSNTVLREAFDGNVRKWLFLSATPIHTSRQDVQAQINKYVTEDFITDDDVADAAQLTKKMRRFLVRRPRKFVIDPLHNEERVKHQYRDHRKEPIKSENPLGVLSMALVQKKLVTLLDGRNNRFRIGFLSSFESLQESVRRSGKKTEEDKENPTDFYIGKDEILRVENDRLPADWDFVTSLDRRFKKKFGDDKYLPHPKLDYTVDLLARAAFEENQKFLVFCRRIRAVEELRRRLDRRWHEWIERRVREVWGEPLDWRGPTSTAEGVEGEVVGEGVETSDELPEDAGFRNASRKGGWLSNYRMTFRDAGRNALVFQENWLAAICKLTGQDLTRLVERIPEEMFQEALSVATREYSGRSRLYPADCLAQLATILVQREPRLLGLDDGQAQTWAKFLATINAPLLNQRLIRRPVRTDRNLLSSIGLWDVWRETFPDPSHPLHLGIRLDATPDELFHREIIKSLIGQSYRLTDVLLDLYFAQQKSQGDQGQFVSRFLDYLTGNSVCAQILRERTAGWIQHFYLILLNCFRTERDRFDLGSMAAKGAFTELNNQTAVVGVTGSAAVNETAIRQFRMPFYPQIIVCTDVLKEGEDLHTFCDQVVHYGVAWTSGDLEQRIGRVDRFFSQIERRLCQQRGAADVKLGIYYPYLDNTLERQQIDLVHARVQDADKILDNFDLSKPGESKEMVIGDDLVVRAEAQKPPSNGHPFADVGCHLPDKGMTVVRHGRKEGERLAQSLREGSSLIAGYLRTQGVAIEGELAEDSVFYTQIRRNGDEIRHRIEWQFVHDLFLHDQGRYALRIMEPVPEEAVWADQFSFAYERHEEKGGYGYYRTHRVITSREPSPSDIRDMFSPVMSYLAQERVSIEDDPKRLAAIQQLLGRTRSLKKTIWEKPHKAELRFVFDRTKQRANLYVYRNMLLIVSRVAGLDDLDAERFGHDQDRPQRVRDWCLDQNRQLTLGFLHVNEDCELNLCERLFVDKLPDSDFQDVVRAVALRADQYEAFLTGEDEN
jgi:hypothetical protein